MLLWYKGTHFVHVQHGRMYCHWWRESVTLIQREEVTSSRLCSRAGLDLLISAGWETWQVGIKAAVLTKSQQQPCDPRSASHPVLCWVSLHAVLHYSPAGSVLAGSVVTALWCLPPWIWSCSKWSLPLYCYFFYTEREECFCWSLSEGLRILGDHSFCGLPGGVAVAQCTLPLPLCLSICLSLLQCLAAAVLCSGQSSALSLELSDWELCPLAAPLILRIQGQTQASPIPELQPAHFE